MPFALLTWVFRGATITLIDKMINNLKLTKKGQEELQSELNILVTDKRPKLVERLAYARSQGDLSENADYQSAKEELEFLDGRIDELTDVLKNAVIIDGTKITVKVNGKESIFDIVGEWEADPKNKKISCDSPLGVALMSKKIGEKAEVEAPAGKIVYEVVAVG